MKVAIQLLTEKPFYSNTVILCRKVVVDAISAVSSIFECLGETKYYFIVKEQRLWLTAQISSVLSITILICFSLLKHNESLTLIDSVKNICWYQVLESFDFGKLAQLFIAIINKIKIFCSIVHTEAYYEDKFILVWK